VVTVSDGSSVVRLNFSVSSVTPPSPSPVQPVSDTMADFGATFEWAPIAAENLPVTYTLQISAQADFSSLVFEKAGLTNAEFTLTGTEMLSPVYSDHPYYWRVKVVDSASNESEWSAAQWFYTANNLTFPMWATWVLIVLGVAAVLSAGFIVGRRTANPNITG